MDNQTSKIQNELMVKNKVFSLCLFVLIIISSCVTIKTPIRPFTTHRFFENIRERKVYNSCLRILSLKGFGIVSEAKDKDLITTNWYYFNKPGINWKYRFRFSLLVSQSSEDIVKVSLMVKFQRGMPIKPRPYLSEVTGTISSKDTISILGYNWKEISVDDYLVRYLDDFFLELKKQLSPIKSNIIFENPHEVRRVKFRLMGISLDRIKNFPFDDGSQKILELKDDYVVIQTFSQTFKEEDAIPIPVEDKKLSKYLRPTFFCQSEDPTIQEQAKKIVGEERNSWRAAKKIAEWINKEMIPTYGFSFASAKEVLKYLQGDCTEYTVLAAALCRAVGIPARAAVGIMYEKGRFDYHMWLEVFVGRWVALDAQFLAHERESGEYYTDATHLKFGRSRLDENTLKEITEAIGDIIGKIKLEIVDYI